MEDVGERVSSQSLRPVKANYKHPLRYMYTCSHVRNGVTEE